MNDQDRLTLATFMAGMQAARQDFFQAAKWSRQAAEPGNRKAHGMMAFFYYAGQGRVPQDTEKARYRAEKGGKSGRAGRRHGARRTGNGVPVSGQTGHERGPYVA